MKTEFDLGGGPFDGDCILFDVEEVLQFSIATPRTTSAESDNEEMALYERFGHESKMYTYIGSENAKSGSSFSFPSK